MESQLNCSAHRFPPPALVKFHKEILVWFSTVNAPQKNLSDRSGEIHGLLPRLLSPKKSSGKIVALVQNEMFQPVIIGLKTQPSILSMCGQQSMRHWPAVPHCQPKLHLS